MKVLIVDDDLEICQFLKTNLEKEPFSVDIANDGKTGIFLGRSNDYDLIILDNVLPEKSGQEVCKEIREKKEGVKILVLSALSDPSIKSNLLDGGADDYVSKPFSYKELLSRMKALLRRSEPICEEIVKIDDLEVDMNNYRVSCKKKNVHLTKKEFMVLEILIRNSGRVVSHGEIMEHVWSLEIDSFSHALKVHINNLRSKIDKGRRKSFIQNIRGIGYKFNV